MPSLSSCIAESLRLGEMVPHLPSALLNYNRTQAERSDETDYWDYKELIDFDNPVGVARLAKDVLGFHNARGGMLVVGVTDKFRAPGVSDSQILDSAVLRAKLRKFTGGSVQLFTDQTPVASGRKLWLIFVPRRTGQPVAVNENGPTDRKGRPEIAKGSYYLRSGSETRLCTEPADLEQVFSGYSVGHLQAYLPDVDEPYFRLMAPHCDQFVGRKELLFEIANSLKGRHPVIALDGIGGVGKTAVAIRLARQLYDSKELMFIVSTSAKNKVWHDGKIGSRRAGFSGLTELLHTIAVVMDIPVRDDISLLKADIVSTLAGLEGLLLVDNIESIEDPAVFRFLSREVPAPVKVLVTSRIDKGLGALTISIPEMNEDEARELLLANLDQAGYHGYLNESEFIDQILAACARLPLALKWAAGMASNSGSLREVSGRLRKSGGKRSEFLNFCFATMYAELSPLAREVALLCSYFGEEWAIPTVAAALARTEEEVARAQAELKDRGVLMASGSSSSSVVVLPLTMDFLASKWHEDSSLRERVASRLEAKVASSDYQRILLSYPRKERVRVLKRRAEELRLSGDLLGAQELVRMATGYLPAADLMFLEGRILFELGRRTDGLARMKAALSAREAENGLVEEGVYLAKALLEQGGGDNELEGLELLSATIPRLQGVHGDSIALFVGTAARRKEYSTICRFVGQMKNCEPEVQLWVARVLEKESLLEGNQLLPCGEDLAQLLFVACKARQVTEEERRRLIEAARRLTSAVTQRSS